MKRLAIFIFLILSLLSISKPAKSDNISLQQSQYTLHQTKLVLSIAESTYLTTKSSLKLTNSHVLEIIPHDESIQHVTHSTLSTEEYFNMFPEAVRNTFYNMGWKWTKTDYDIGPIYGFDKILGLTIWSEKQIYINYQHSANSSILHEVGHAFEYSSYVKGANSKEFLELYNENWQSWHNKYGMHINNYNTPEEGYAQCWEIYMLKPDCLDDDTRAFIEFEIYGIK